MTTLHEPRPYMDKAVPEAWEAASAFATAVSEAASQRGLSPAESELIKVRASQMNGCVFCLDLHSRQARRAGVKQQLLDILPAWRESTLFSERERALLAIAEAATRLPLDAAVNVELAQARSTLSEAEFAAAEWVAAAINMFNRISILSEHRVRPRDSEGKLS